MQYTNTPIGIFDSGIGGLTVARAIKEQLPYEKIIYFGDTEHFPYGEKSTVEIQEYCIKIVEWLLQQQCKMIVIACYSASVAAADLLKKIFGQQAIIVDAVDPLLSYLGSTFANKTLGLIGTTRTIESQVYEHKISELDANIAIKPLATPLLAPAIEHHFEKNTVQKLLIEYLEHKELENIDGLILGCTHYPLIADDIEAYYQDKVSVIDPSRMIANRVARALKEQRLLAEDQEENRLLSYYRYHISHQTHSFLQNVQLFFKELVPFAPEL